MFLQPAREMLLDDPQGARIGRLGSGKPLEYVDLARGRHPGEQLRNQVGGELSQDCRRRLRMFTSKEISHETRFGLMQESE